MIETTEIHFVDGPNRYITNPRWRTAANHRKTAISRQWFDRLMRNLAWWVILALRIVLTVKISNFKNPIWRRVAILKNRELAISTQRFDRLVQNLACWCTLALRTLLAFKISNFYKSKMADGRHLEKSKNGHISALQRLDRSARNMALWYIFTVRTVFEFLKIQYGGQLLFW